MRFTMYKSSFQDNNSVEVPGGTMTGSLILSGLVNGTLDAVHKQYVDTSVLSLDASNVKTGVFAAARMPGFTGDAVSANGSTNITLKPIPGLTPGDYNKVTVNAKGLVTIGGSLVESDLPDMGWDKVSLDRPTTLAGYGIQDGLSSDGGVLTGNLVITEPPTNPMDLITKGYLGGGGVGGYSVGDIIDRPITATPSGFFRCNGGELVKADYPALYGEIGETFSYTTPPGAGTPWINQTDIVPDGVIGNWAVGGNLPVIRMHGQAFVTKSRAYYLGGHPGGGGSTSTSTVYTAPINSDGTLGAWVATTSLPAPCFAGAVAVTKNRVFLIGGHNGTAVTGNVYSAPINEDGTIGTWVAGSPVPVSLATPSIVVTRTKLHVLGGGNATTYSANINSDGTIGAWSSGLNLAFTTQLAGLCVRKNRVHLLGGTTGTVWENRAQSAPINSDGTIGPWTITTLLLPDQLCAGAVISCNKRLFLIGGINGATQKASVYTSDLTGDGNTRGWAAMKPIPTVLSHTSAIVTNNRIYLLGGSTPTGTNTALTATYTGGGNDYSPYYNGKYVGTDPLKFRLPDYSANETTGDYYFIKF